MATGPYGTNLPDYNTGISGYAGGITPPNLQQAPSVPMQGGDWWSQNAPPQAQQGAAGGGPSVDFTASPDAIRQQVKAYAASRGYQMSDQEAQAWVNYAPDLVSRGQQLGDPNYGMMRLSKADQWTSPDQRYAAGGTDTTGAGGQMGTFQADPGYQWGLQQGLDAEQKFAAAKGTLLTGGTQKGLERYAQDYANQQFGNVFNRNLQLAQLGLQGTGGIVNAAGQYGTNAANAVTGQGNAAAAGTIGAGNAWMGTLGQLGQLGAGYAANYPYGRQSSQPTPYSGPIYGPGY